MKIAIRIRLTQTLSVWHPDAGYSDLIWTRVCHWLPWNSYRKGYFLQKRYPYLGMLSPIKMSHYFSHTPSFISDPINQSTTKDRYNRSGRSEGGHGWDSWLQHVPAHDVAPVRGRQTTWLQSQGNRGEKIRFLYSAGSILFSFASQGTRKLIHLL